MMSLRPSQSRRTRVARPRLPRPRRARDLSRAAAGLAVAPIAARRDGRRPIFRHAGGQPRDDPVYHWRISAGHLPRGLRLSKSGELHGVARQPGTFTFTVLVRDSTHPSMTATQALRLIVMRHPLDRNRK